MFLLRGHLVPAIDYFFLKGITENENEMVRKAQFVKNCSQDYKGSFTHLLLPSRSSDY